MYAIRSYYDEGFVRKGAQVHPDPRIAEPGTRASLEGVAARREKNGEEKEEAAESDAPFQRRDSPGQAAIPRTGRCGGFLDAACGTREKLRRAEPAASGRKVASVAERKLPASPCDELVRQCVYKTQH